MSLGNIIMRKPMKFLVLVLCFGSDVYATITTTQSSETTTPEITTAEPVTGEILEEDEMFQAVNLDVGRYTTQVYEYLNNQFMRGPGEEVDRCMDDYIKCTISLTANTPVCAFNYHKNRARGYLTTLSYCDVYFDNCRRDLRVWRILDSGYCKFYFNNEYDNVHNTYRRLNNPLLYNLLNILSKQSGKTDIQISKLPSGKSQRSETEENWIYLEGTPVFITGRHKNVVN